MKKPIFLFLIFLIPIAYAFSGTSDNFQTTATLSLGAVEEQSSENYTTKATMVNQPIGIFDSENYFSYSGPDYLLELPEYELLNMLLKTGWNLISVPLLYDDNTLGNILSSIEGNYGNVFSYRGEWKQLDSNDEINVTTGLWIKMLSDDTLEFNGTDPIYVKLKLKQGYNLIGYPSLKLRNASSIFKNINDSLISLFSYKNNAWFSYSPLKDNNIIIKPGYGYWVNVNDNVSLVIS